ncbi:MAG: hypothetical protein BWY79_01716 [Actinobacteria bacterium ADurb.Bin444]|nr:MAG: hypothetical protein BWY79_01716 [Actinobacteria bacterium ADurb.Bin444]
MNGKEWRARLDEMAKKYDTDDISVPNLHLLYARKAGAYGVLTELMFQTIETLERKVDHLERELKHSIHRQDAVPLMARFAGVVDKEAMTYMESEGYFDDLVEAN